MCGMPHPMPLKAIFLPRRPGYTPKASRVGFELDEATVGQMFCTAFLFKSSFCHGYILMGAISRLISLSRAGRRAKQFSFCALILLPSVLYLSLILCLLLCFFLQFSLVVCSSFHASCLVLPFHISLIDCVYDFLSPLCMQIHV
jgi:hypothetical protein